MGVQQRCTPLPPALPSASAGNLLGNIVLLDVVNAEVGA